jgi:hypothetical protein
MLKSQISRTIGFRGVRYVRRDNLDFDAFSAAVCKEFVPQVHHAVMTCVHFGVIEIWIILVFVPQVAKPRVLCKRPAIARHHRQKKVVVHVLDGASADHSIRLFSVEKICPRISKSQQSFFFLIHMESQRFA